jgi:Family of unknown function (DUF5996)
MTTSPLNQAGSFSDEVWPALPWAAWGDTCATLQMWMQVVGKIRLALMPRINHTWNVTLYPTIRGVTTGPMPYGREMLEIDFDFVEHVLLAQRSDSTKTYALDLEPMAVSHFYRELMEGLEWLGAPVRIWPQAMEVAEPVRLDTDEAHHAYDAEYANRFWRVLLQTTRVMTAFRARFQGKVSPVHLFWGAMDLACTRFSGRTAPEHASMPGLPDRVVRDAYSHEVSSAGFWPGALGMDAMFYSYAYPDPAGYRDYKIAPAAAGFSEAFGEFVLSYEAMRTAADPDGALMEFLQSTYEAAAVCAKWDRAGLEVG